MFKNNNPTIVSVYVCGGGVCACINRQQIQPPLKKNHIKLLNEIKTATFNF